MAKVVLFLCFLATFTANCSNTDASVTEEGAGTRVQREVEKAVDVAAEPVASGRPAAYETQSYVPRLRGKRIALLVNQTSNVGSAHLVDTLQSLGLDLKKIFAPEHGFRGSADAGASIKDGIDQRSGLPIKSLYGKNKKPSTADLADVDVIVFDIQDVGARFYTYISTLFYVMEAAALHGKEVLVLDRPNPNGHLVDGPVLQPEFSSFVGIAPIPVAHGLTVGEFARMVNGEGWLPDGIRADLSVIPMPGYRHDQVYDLPVKPSPNLPNPRSIYLYPSLCFFEGTAVSVGRGTDKQFQIVGHPKWIQGDYTFTPKPGPGSANPKLKGQLCRGFDLSKLTPEASRTTELNISYLVEAYRELTAQGVTFFTKPDFFDLLAGTDELRKRIIAGDSPAEIRNGWAAELADYKRLREGYLMYP